MVWKVFGVAAGIVVATTSAFADPRPLEVPATASWQHARTGLILRPTLAGQARRTIGDYGTGEFDIIANYDDRASGTYTTIYLFHPGLDSVPVWFDRIRVAAVSRPQNGLPDGPEVSKAFAVRDGGIADGLRLVIPLKNGSNRSTAVAVAPIDDWLLVVRMSSPSLDAAALDDRLTAVLKDVPWPASGRKPREALLVEACADQLRFKRARQKKADMMQALIGSALASAAAEKSKDKPDEAVPVFCRDREGPDGQWALYRANGGRSSYVLALGDAGRAITVNRSLAAQLNSDDLSGAYSVAFLDLDKVLQFPDFDRMPPPEQAIEIATRTAPISSVSRDGQQTNIQLDPSLVKPK